MRGHKIWRFGTVKIFVAHFSALLREVKMCWYWSYSNKYCSGLQWQCCVAVRREGTTIVKFQIRSVCNIAVTPLTRRIVLEFAVPTSLMLVPTLLYQHFPSQAEVFHERGGLCSVRWADVLPASRPGRGPVQQVHQAGGGRVPVPTPPNTTVKQACGWEPPHGNQDSHPCFQLQSITGDLNLPASSGRAGRRTAEVRGRGPARRRREAGLQQTALTDYGAP